MRWPAILKFFSIYCSLIGKVNTSQGWCFLADWEIASTLHLFTSETATTTAINQSALFATIKANYDFLHCTLQDLAPPTPLLLALYAREHQERANPHQTFAQRTHTRVQLFTPIVLNLFCFVLLCFAPLCSTFFVLCFFCRLDLTLILLNAAAAAAAQSINYDQCTGTDKLSFTDKGNSLIFPTNF